MPQKPYKRKNGNLSKSDRYIKIEHWIIRSKAWQILSPREVRILLLLLERYNGVNNGRISLSIREAARHGKMSKTTAQKAIERLTELGFIKITFKGSFSQKIIDNSGRWYASEYALTCKPIGNNPATKEFMSWLPNKITVPKQVQLSTSIEPIGNNGVI